MESYALAFLLPSSLGIGEGKELVVICTAINEVGMPQSLFAGVCASLETMMFQLLTHIRLSLDNGSRYYGRFVCVIPETSRRDVLQSVD